MAATVIVGIAAFGVSLLTLFSGFGLGTLLMPVFALFFPVEVAVASTAVVHAANNLFKVGLLARGASVDVAPPKSRRSSSSWVCSSSGSPCSSSFPPCVR